MRQPWFLLAVMALGLVFATTIDASDPNYRINATSGSGSVGGTVDIDFSVDLSTDITGWSWSVCHTGNLSITDDSDIAPSTTVSDAVTLFTSESVEPGGHVVAGLLDVGPPQEYILAQSGLLMYTVTYNLDAEGCGLLTICDSLGAATIADNNGLEISPAVFGGTITVDGSAGYKFSVQDPGVVPYDSNFPDGVTFSTTVSIEEDSGNSGYPNDVQGFKFGVGHDGAVLEVTAVELGNTDLTDMNDGSGPIYFGANMTPSQGAGFTVGCVFSFIGTEVMTFDSETVVVDVTYGVESDELDGNKGGLQTALNFDETIASPVVENAVVVGEVETDDVAGYGAIVTFEDSTGTFFLRGDVDNDGTVSALLDAQYGLNWVFGDGDEPGCHDSMDINDDGNISALLDMLALLWWAFGDGAAPAAPGPAACGIDSTDDDGITCLNESVTCE